MKILSSVRMKKQYLFLIFVFSACFYGCANRSAVIMEDYDGKRIYGKNLAVIKLFNKAIISNIDDVTDDLGSGVPDEVYTAFFNDKFIAAFRKSNNFDEVFFLDNIYKSELEERVLEISDEEKMKILLPKENNNSKNDSLYIDFILVIDNLLVSRIPGNSGIWTNGVYSGGSFGKLFHQIYFAIWDNINQIIVSYGRIEDESTIIFGMTKDNWESVLNGLAEKILSYSPFPIKQTYLRQ